MVEYITSSGEVYTTESLGFSLGISQMPHDQRRNTSESHDGYSTLHTYSQRENLRCMVTA